MENRDRNQALRDALEPFLKAAEPILHDDSDERWNLAEWSIRAERLTVGNFRELHAAALAMQEPASEPAKGACPVCGCEEVDHRDLWTCRCPASEPAPACDHVWGVGDYCVACLKCGVEKVEPAPTSAPSFEWLREAFDGDSVPAKNIALRKAYDLLTASAPSCFGWEEAAKIAADTCGPDVSRDYAQACQDIEGQLNFRASLARVQPCQCGELREGWVMVPRYPTAEMKTAGASITEDSHDLAHECWNRMLSAATAPLSLRGHPAMTHTPTDRDQALRDALEKLEQVALDAVSHVRQTNYAARESEAMHWIRMAADEARDALAMQEPAPCGDPARYDRGECLGPECPICEPAIEPVEPDAEWIWFGVVDGQNVVTFGRWPKHGSQKRYKLADIQPTEHDHPPASEPAPASAPYRFDRWKDGQLMAEGIVIEHAGSLEQAIQKALRLCPEPKARTVLVYQPASASAPSCADLRRNLAVSEARCRVQARAIERLSASAPSCCGAWEEAAKICEDLADKVFHPNQTITDRCAAAIRARAQPCQCGELREALAAELRQEAREICEWNGETMRHWDGWRAAISAGDQSSWPRDAFESLMSHHADLMERAANALAATAPRSGESK